MSSAGPPPEPITPASAPLPPLEQLPDDPETLKRMILELVATLRQRDHDLEAARARLALLLQRLYGRKSERVNPDQLLLFGEDGATAVEAPAEARSDTSTRKRRARPHGRRKLPESLPQRPVHHELREAELICVCGTPRIDIGVEDGGQQLDWQPASFFVWQHWIHKYLCPKCAARTSATPPTAAAATAAPVADGEPMPAIQDEPTAALAVVAEPTPTRAVTTEPMPTPWADAEAPSTASMGLVPPPPSPSLGPIIITASKPPMPIAKGLPGPGLLAHVIVSKYDDHLPLYRQEHISERQGVFIPRSTSCDWMAACADLLRPLYELMVRAVMQSLWLHTDDTLVLNLGHEAGTTDKARFWIYYGDRTHPYNVFDFTINRQRDGPQTFLADFHGYLHADAFSGYDALFLPNPRAESEPIKEVACNAHARRKFYDARLSAAVHAHQALAYYAQLYDLERAAAADALSDEQRRQMRQDLAVPILEQFKKWLDQTRAQVLPKSPMAEAIGYALNNWTALIRYTEAGFLAIDNNVAEREMKHIAIGRKNWLFVGSANGGRTAAVLFSFTSTCRRLKIEPWAYLQDLLTRLPRMSAGDLTELLPDRWQATRQASLGPSTAPTSPLPIP